MSQLSVCACCSKFYIRIPTPWILLAPTSSRIAGTKASRGTNLEPVSWTFGIFSCHHSCQRIFFFSRLVTRKSDSCCSGCSCSFLEAREWFSVLPAAMQLIRVSQLWDHRWVDWFGGWEARLGRRDLALLATGAQWEPRRKSPCQDATLGWAFFAFRPTRLARST